MEDIVIAQVEGATVLYFNILENWDSFEIIVNQLKKDFSASVIARVDGPESKFCKMLIGTANMTVLNDPYGNELRADNKDGDKLLHEIFEKWRGSSGTFPTQ